MWPTPGSMVSLAKINLLNQAAKHSFGAEQYWEWARIFSRLAHTDVDNGLSDLIVPFLDIGKEGELQGQIKSVVRDLQIMLHITKQQLEVSQKFEKCMLQFSRGKKPVNMEPLLTEFGNCIQDLEDMSRTADGISTSVGARPVMRPSPHAVSKLTDQLDYLISLKQQQVTVVQAWQSMKEAEDTRKQNVTLLVFTVVTVVFVSRHFNKNMRQPWLVSFNAELYSSCQCLSSRAYSA